VAPGEKTHADTEAAGAPRMAIRERLSSVSFVLLARSLICDIELPGTSTPAGHRCLLPPEQGFLLRRRWPAC